MAEEEAVEFHEEESEDVREMDEEPEPLDNDNDDGDDRDPDMEANRFGGQGGPTPNMGSGLLGPGGFGMPGPWGPEGPRSGGPGPWERGYGPRGMRPRGFSLNSRPPAPFHHGPPPGFRGGPPGEPNQQRMRGPMPPGMRGPPPPGMRGPHPRGGGPPSLFGRPPFDHSFAQGPPSGMGPGGPGMDGPQQHGMGLPGMGPPSGMGPPGPISSGGMGQQPPPGMGPPSGMGPPMMPGGMVCCYHSNTRESAWSKPENVKVIAQAEVEAMALGQMQGGQPGTNRPSSGSGSGGSTGPGGAASTAAQVARAQVMDDERHTSSIVFELEDVLFHILNNLSTKVLDQAARVNVTWNRVAKQIKQKRKHFWFCYLTAENPGGMEKKIGPVLNMSFQSFASDPHFVLILGSQALRDIDICVPSESMPSGIRVGGVKREKLSFTGYLDRTAPPSCHLIGVVTNPVVATRRHSDQVIMSNQGISASLLFFPKLDEIDIYRFSLKENFGDGLTKDLFRAKTGIPENKSPKLILLFWRFTIGNSHYFTPHKFISKILEIDKDVIVAGGNVQSLFVDRSLHLETHTQIFDPQCLGIAFCGSDLHVTSVVIQADKRKELVETELSRLKAVHLPDKCSVGFMFCNKTRLSGQLLAGKRNVETFETKAFRKLFPDVPLFGLLDDSEIGFDHLSGNSDVKASVDYSKIKYCHKGTAIFVILYFP